MRGWWAQGPILINFNRFVSIFVRPDGGRPNPPCRSRRLTAARAASRPTLSGCQASMQKTPRMAAATASGCAEHLRGLCCGGTRCTYEKNNNLCIPTLKYLRWQDNVGYPRPGRTQKHGVIPNACCCLFDCYLRANCCSYTNKRFVAAWCNHAVHRTCCLQSCVWGNNKKVCHEFWPRD